MEAVEAKTLYRAPWRLLVVLWKVLVAIWDWAGQVAEFKGRIEVLLFGGALLVGVVLVILRVSGVVNFVALVVGVIAIILGIAGMLLMFGQSGGGSGVTSPAEAVPPLRLSTEESMELGQEAAKIAKAIYAFLDKHAARTDEPKVVAEYRRKFDAKVLNLCLDIIAGGGATTEHLKNAMKPPATVDDIQWVARVLSIAGEGFNPNRLARYRAMAMKELGLEGVLEGEDLEAVEKRLAELRELMPFVNEYPTADLTTYPRLLEEWMKREQIPQAKRQQMRETMEGALKEIYEKDAS